MAPLLTKVFHVLRCVTGHEQHIEVVLVVQLLVSDESLSPIMLEPSRYLNEFALLEIGDPLVLEIAVDGGICISSNKIYFKLQTEVEHLLELVVHLAECFTTSDVVCMEHTDSDLA